MDVRFCIHNTRYLIVARRVWPLGPMRSASKDILHTRLGLGLGLYLGLGKGLLVRFRVRYMVCVRVKVRVWVSVRVMVSIDIRCIPLIT